MGTGHGWASVHSVAWNCSAPGRAFVVQKPPTAQNYAIGCWVDTVAATTPIAPFTHPLGHVEGTRRSGLEPRSLFYAQLAMRHLGTTGVEAITEESVPGSWALLDVYPNPMNPETRIEVQLQRSGPASLTVYDLLGREIAEIFRGELSEGRHAFRWSPERATSGIYILRLHVQPVGSPSVATIVFRKILLLR
jgi:hypothetical protein